MAEKQQQFYSTNKLKPFKPYSTLLIMSYCALRRKDSFCALVSRFCVSRKGGTGGGGWGHPQGAVHMAAARLGCKRTMVGTGWANSRLGCMSKLRKCYSHHSGGSILAGKPFFGSKRVFANREC